MKGSKVSDAYGQFVALKIRMNDKKSIEEFLSDIDSDLLQYAGELSFDNQTSKFTRPLWNDLAPHHKRL